MAGPVNIIESTARTAPVRQSRQTETRVLSRDELTFGKLLNERLDQEKNSELQFSRHAAARVSQRGIEMTPGLMGDLKSAVEKARVKGAKDVVVIGSAGAFIVNVPNNVVVTTMSTAEMKDNIFTNIDSAVIM